MRISTLGLGMLAVLLAGSTAFAAGGGATQSGKGTLGSTGKGSGPGSAGSTGGGDSDTGVSPGQRNPDVVAGEEEVRPWAVGGTWETHRLIRQNDVQNSSKNMNVLGAYAQYDITEVDRIKLRAYLYQRFIADQGETGFRFDDMILQYTRTVPLPAQFTLAATGWVTIPTSLQSQKMGNITTPRLALGLEKKFGEYVVASVRTSGDAYIDKYRTNEGGGTNPKFAYRFGADLEVLMPFHKQLSIGASAGTGYTWYYQPTSGTGDTNISAQQNGSTADTQFQSQPILQSYSGEIFVRYVLPTVVGMKSDITVAAADGDPSLGSVSVLHDGVAHFYPGYRQAAEVYGVLSVRY